MNEASLPRDEQPVAGGSSGSRVPAGTILAAVGAVALFATLLGMMFFSRPIKDVKPGETARVGAAAASIGLACAATRQKFDVMIAAAIARDLKRFDSVTGDAVVLQQGDTVKVLERFGDKQQNAKLQVDSGKFKGRTCYSEIDAPDFLE